jgi:hypothetical protein
MKKQEQAAIKCVADQFSAVWKESDGSPGAWLTPAGRRVAVEIATLGSGAGAKPRLRFDRVALGLIGRLQTALHDTVPNGTTAIVTVAAPIRLAAKTTAALEQTIRTALAARTDIADEIHGNRIRIRVVKTGAAQAPRLVGFVHNPDPGAGLALLDGTEAVLGCMAAT